MYCVTVYDKLIRTTDDCVWHVDSSFHGRFTIDVEFLDLKISPLNVSLFSRLFSIRFPWLMTTAQIKITS